MARSAAIVVLILSIHLLLQVMAEALLSVSACPMEMKMGDAHAMNHAVLPEQERAK